MRWYDTFHVQYIHYERLHVLSISWRATNNIRRREDECKETRSNFNLLDLARLPFPRAVPHVAVVFASAIWLSTHTVLYGTRFILFYVYTGQPRLVARAGDEGQAGRRRGDCALFSVVDKRLLTWFEFWSQGLLSRSESLRIEVIANAWSCKKIRLLQTIVEASTYNSCIAAFAWLLTSKNNAMVLAERRVYVGMELNKARPYGAYWSITYNYRRRFTPIALRAPKSRDGMTLSCSYYSIRRTFLIDAVVQAGITVGKDNCGWFKKI